MKLPTSWALAATLLAACAAPHEPEPSSAAADHGHAHGSGAMHVHDGGAPHSHAGGVATHDHAHADGHDAGHSHDDRSRGCTCASARLANAWCAVHLRGYVGGQTIESRVLFDALDAHGHDLDPGSIECATCRRMMDEGGFCESCRFGWLDGQAYMSRITYHLAQGEARDLAAVECPGCRTLAGAVGWCSRCGGGWAGNVYFEDRTLYEPAARELGRLRKAIEESARCETCASVILVDGTCPYCRIAWVDGRAVGEGR